MYFDPNFREVVVFPSIDRMPVQWFWGDCRNVLFFSRQQGQQRNSIRLFYRRIHARVSRLHLLLVTELQPVSNHCPTVSVLWHQRSGVEWHRGGDCGALPCFQKVPSFVDGAASRSTNVHVKKSRAQIVHLINMLLKDVSVVFSYAEVNICLFVSQGLGIRRAERFV